ncbi:MAG: sigma-70 family RNA polymerase sigma factor [Erysipelotrichales bacterium]|nr:sigma-70 family RNA polymerase sigma factor [Erysipelotrichales bacterium]
MKDKIESSLFSALQKGDEKEIKRLYENIYNQYYKLVYFCVAKFIADNEIIKDLVNESFLIFFENVSNINRSMKYYLLNIAKNQAKTYLKKSKNIDYVDDSIMLNFPDDDVKSSEIYISLIDDLKCVLSDLEVGIIIYHAVDGLTFKELETKYNIKAKTINKMYERAIKKFKKSERSYLYEK